MKRWLLFYRVNGLEAIAETLEIMASPEAMSAIRKHQAGKTKFYPLSALDED